MLLAVLTAGCSQDEIVTSEIDGNVAKNSFSEYVGVPFEGEINFSRDEDAMTRMGLSNGNYAFVEGDKVGLVWTNATAIANKIGTVENADFSEWSVWASDWKIFSNTRMTYENIDGKKVWHMTDGQIFKGNYFAYSPYNPAIQSVSKFRVEQKNKQSQKSTNGNNLAECSNHILDNETGLVWISQNIPASTSDLNQNLSFIYTLAEQNKESGTANEVNMQMRPFSNILDTRLTVLPGTMTEENAKKIKIQSVDLIASSNVFATKASFDMSKWGNAKNANGVFAYKYDNTDPKAYTWNVNGVSSEPKYKGEALEDTVTTTIENQVANNGESQRVQLMLLPRYYADKVTTEKASEKYKLRVNTDYGYIEVDEIGGWYKRVAGKEGVIVNPAESQDFEAITSNETDENKLNYVLARIGARATRYISFNASDLEYNNIAISNKADLLDALRKWNELGKSGVFTVVPKADCNIADLIWNESTEAVALKHYDLAKNGQPETETETLGQAEQVIVDFLADTNNSLKITGGFVMSGTNAIDAARLIFDGSVNLEGTLAVTGTSQAFRAINTTAEAKVYVANDPAAKMTINAVSEWNGEATLYGQGTITVNQNLTNYGVMNINGTLSIAKTLTNTFNEVKNPNGGIANLFANASVIGKGTLFNNATLNYVDVPTAFTAKKTNKDKIVAAITAANQDSHRSEYLNSANAFGATDLTIEGSNIAAEWNNLKSLTSFERVEMKNLTMKVFQNVDFSNAIVTVVGKVSLTKNTTAATPSVKISKFVLDSKATLTVKDLKIEEANLTEMGNNTYLYGYDCFSQKSKEPVKTGDGFHKVFNSNKEEMFK